MVRACVPLQRQSGECGVCVRGMRRMCDDDDGGHGTCGRMDRGSAVVSVVWRAVGTSRSSAMCSTRPTMRPVLCAVVAADTKGRSMQ